MVGAWPLVMGVTMWFQMKLNPAPPDPAQKMIFDWMPVIFTFMLARFSSGLVIYWAWNNTLSVIQQSVIMRRHGAKIELLDNFKSMGQRLKGLFNKPSARGVTRRRRSFRHAAAPPFTAREIEAGRRLFAGDWRFARPRLRCVAAADERARGRLCGPLQCRQIEPDQRATDRNALARTSHTPGRTQELIFFAADDRLTLVDMPGYGYAAAPKTKVAAWTELIHAYLNGRANLARVYVLVDARRGLPPDDDIPCAPSTTPR